MCIEDRKVSIRSFKERSEKMKKRFSILLLAIMTMMCVAFATAGAEAAERDIEWGCYQNSSDNNGVVGDNSRTISRKRKDLIVPNDEKF